MKKYVKQTTPYVVPTDDGKTIREHFGRSSTGGGALSVAHMTAPPGWGEPHQTPEFDEITFMIRGRKKIEVDGEIVEVKAGESILVKKGARVRYSNPYEEEAEYVAICLPAFSLEKVHRES